jgi:hypothetical protein
MKGLRVGQGSVDLRIERVGEDAMVFADSTQDVMIDVLD